MTQTYSIFINNLKLKCIIGVHSEERVNPQPIIAQIKLTAKKPSTNDNYQDVPCYQKITQDIENITQNIQPQLLETLAQEIINICLNDNRIINAKVTLEKPQALNGKAIPAIQYYQEKNHD